MNKTILTAAVMLALSSGVAQADVTVNGTHQSAVPNMTEDYYITANNTGSSNIFIASQKDTGGSSGTYSMDGLLSVWQEVGSNWVLVGANDDAARNYGASPSGSQSVYGTPTLDFIPQQGANSGKTDPGLTLTLTAGSTYLIIQSESQNGPLSLSNLSLSNTTTGAAEWGGQALGQTFAVGANPQTALWGIADAFSQGAPYPSPSLPYTIINPYTLTVTGNVAFTAAPVPLPAAVWLFGSALAGLGVTGRKKAEGHRLA